MSRSGDLFVLAEQVSIAAREEASRYDAPEVDVDHVLLALLVGGGPAGALLREQGWPVHTGWRRLRQILLSPAHRVVARITLIQCATSISRALR